MLKLTVIAVGRPGALLADAIREYEQRASRYWSFEVIEVKQQRGGADEAAVRAAESARVLERVPRAAELWALTRVGGDAWSSARLARYLQERNASGASDLALMIGGAFGLSDEAIRMADRRVRLSAFTLPHDLARLVLAEQIYRAGTIVRDEPYHKGAE